MTAAKAPSRVRGALVFGAKLLLAAGLITWLVRSGTLDFAKFGVLLDQPMLLVASLLLYAVGIAMGAARWKVLLTLAKVDRPFSELWPLQMIGAFFNVAIPGSVGGDVVKSLTVARGEDPSKRPTILLIVLVDRLCGLAALVTLATFIMLVRGVAVWADPLSLTVALMGVGSIVFPALFIFAVRRNDQRLERVSSGTTGIGRIVGQLIAATRLVSKGPRALALAVLISMTWHAGAMVYFTVLTRAISGQDVTFAAIASVFPLGLLTVVVPISPGGLGVGHVAFEKLLAAIGISGGATIFNVYIISQIVLSLAGVIPYVMLKSKSALQTEVSAP